MDTIYNLLSDKVFDAVDTVKYELIGLQQEVPQVPNKIEIRMHTKPGFAWIESPEYPGIFASGNDVFELLESLNDAIYSYFGVPRYTAKKSPNIFNLPLPDGRIVVEKSKHNFAVA